MASLTQNSFSQSEILGLCGLQQACLYQKQTYAQKGVYTCSSWRIQCRILLSQGCTVGVIRSGEGASGKAGEINSQEVHKGICKAFTQKQSFPVFVQFCGASLNPGHWFTVLIKPVRKHFSSYSYFSFLLPSLPSFIPFSLSLSSFLFKIILFRHIL